MTRTTELLKGCRNKRILNEDDKSRVINLRILCQENYLCQSCKSELKGRLKALKEELSFWEKSGFTEMLLGFPLIKERIASIQEEIKLIETAGVGK